MEKNQISEQSGYFHVYFWSMDHSCASLTNFSFIFIPISLIQFNLFLCSFRRMLDFRIKLLMSPVFEGSCLPGPGARLSWTSMGWWIIVTGPRHAEQLRAGHHCHAGHHGPCCGQLQGELEGGKNMALKFQIYVDQRKILTFQLSLRELAGQVW